MQTETATATPTKLRTGAWGATVPGQATAGQTITITTRSGKSWRAVIERVIWTGPSKRSAGEISICATRSLDRPAQAPRRSSRDFCDCDADCCARGCRCTRQCNCQGGLVYDC